MKKSDAFAFAVAGAVMTALLFGILNYAASPGVLWCIYPIYAVAWWPIGVYFAGKGKHLALSVAGSALTILFLAATNLVTSPHTWWFLYAVLPILCWPLSIALRGRMLRLPAALLFSAVAIAYYTIFNLLTSPGYFWALYPIYATLWWPMGRYFSDRRAFRGFSVAGFLLTAAFLLAANAMNPGHPWAVYAIFPVVWWPLAMFFGRRLGALRFSVLCALCTMAWYSGCNLLLSPGVPWSMFVGYAVLWWPLSVYYHGKHRPLGYAVTMTALTALLLTAVNILFTPGALWAFYPVFALLWWPVSVFFAQRRDALGFSVVGALLIIAFLSAVNLVTPPGFPLSVFPSLCVLWWPLSVYFAKHKSAFGYAVAGTLLGSSLFIAINLLTSPGFLWCVFPTFGMLWWPLSVGFFSRKQKTA